MTATMEPKPKPRKRKPPETLDRLPPHSPEAEQGVLGCIMLAPKESLAQCAGLDPRAFYDLRHQTIYQAICGIKPAELDIITLQQRLKDSGSLDEVGGLTYLSALQDAVPSAGNLSYYLGIVREKHQRRRIIQTCTDAITRAYDAEGNPEDILWATESDIAGLAGDASADDGVTSPQHIQGYPVDADPNCLIGNRYICRRGALIIVGPSGIGKSSLIMQLSCGLAIGKSVFGIKPPGPLKVLVVQAENDDGDLCEMLTGVQDGLEMTMDDVDLLNRNLTLKSDSIRTGLGFISALRRLVHDRRPDIVVLDPAVSFIGDDLSKQKACSDFFRVGLNSIAAAYGCAFVVINHTTKPPADAKSRSGWQSSDWQYAGAGSYDMVGWARAVMVLRQVGDNAFVLKLSKRGKRAGATHPDGTPTTELWLRHSSDSICWEQMDPPEEREEAAPRPKAERKTKVQQIQSSNLHEILSKIPKDGESAASLGERFHTWSIKHGIGLGPTSCRTSLLYALASDQCKKLRYDERSKLWFRGENA